MAASLVTVTGTFLNADGTAAGGTVSFRLSAPFSNGGSIYPLKTFQATLAGTGQISQVLAANDGAATPSGTYYNVLEQLTDVPEREYQIVVPTLGALQSVTGVADASPGVVTVPNHGFSTGDTVIITGVLGATQANGIWDVTVIDQNTFSIPTDVTGVYTSGGTVGLWVDLSILMPNTSPGIGGS